MNAALWLIAPLNRIINSAGKIAGAPGFPLGDGRPFS
jgi:hypothetical protein